MPLEEIKKFKKFFINDGVIEWKNEIDLAPEYLYKIGKPMEGQKKSPEPDYVRWSA